MKTEYIAKAISSIAVCVAGGYIATIPDVACLGPLIILGGLAIIWDKQLLSIGSKPDEQNG